MISSSSAQSLFWITLTLISLVLFFKCHFSGHSGELFYAVHDKPGETLCMKITFPINYDYNGLYCATFTGREDFPK